MTAGAQLLLFAALLPVLSGFSFLERPSPDVEEGNRQLMRGNAQVALQAYERALGAYPDDLRIHYNRGAALLALGRMPEAEREFLLGTQSPDGTLRADSFYNLGNALLQQSRLKEAIDAYKRSLILRPGDRHAKWNLELALRKLREQEEEKKQKEQQQKQEQQAQSGQQQQDPSQQQQQQQQDPSQQQQDPSQQQQDPSAQPSPAGAGPDAGTGANRPDQPQQNQPQQNQQPNPLQQNQQQQNQQQANPQKANPQQQNPQQQNQPQQGPSPDPRSPNGRPEAPPPSSASPGTAGQGQGQQGQAAARAPGAVTPRDTERQDAEAVLDAFEAVEPTVQKDLARRRAGNRRPRKDW
jgi:Ca-activated chloride channel family protein